MACKPLCKYVLTTAQAPLCSLFPGLGVTSLKEPRPLDFPVTATKILWLFADPGVYFPAEKDIFPLESDHLSPEAS